MRGHQVGRGRLEGLDELAELLLLEAPRQPGEADEVGEAHGEAPVDHLGVVGRLDDAAGGGGELPAPDVDEELLQLGQEQLDQRIRDLGAAHALLRLGQALQEGVDLPVGEPGGGLPGGAGHLDGHGLAEQARLDQARQPAQGQHVRLRQRLGLADVGEAHGAPEAGGEVHGDAGGAGGLEGGVAALGAEDEGLQAEGEGVSALVAGLLLDLLGRGVPVRSTVLPRGLDGTGGAPTVGGHRPPPVRSVRTALPIAARLGSAHNDTSGVP